MRLEKKIDGAVYYRECPKLDLACGRVLTKKLLQQGFLDFFGVEYLEGQVGRASGGKPYYGGFLDCAFNVSHCKSGAVAAVSKFQIGVDVEGLRRINSRTVRSCCNREECVFVFGKPDLETHCGSVLTAQETKRFLKLWTLKESYVKMTGEGLRHPLREVCFDVADLKNQREGTVYRIKGNDACSSSFLLLTENLWIALTVCSGKNAESVNFRWNPVT